MAIELRHRARTAERSEPIDPSQTGPRTRLPDSSSNLRSHAEEPRASTDPRQSDRPSNDRHSVVPDRHSSMPASRARVSRPSMRPSAFGMPRTSAPPAPDSAPRVRESAPPGELRLRADEPRPSTRSRAEATRASTNSSRAEATRASTNSSRAEATRASTQFADDVPASSQIVQKRPRVGAPPPAVTTDIEELLPISQGVKSLPRPPRLPSVEVAQQPAPTPRRFPWASLTFFAVMLTASLVPLFHYRGEGKQSEPRVLRAELRALEPEPRVEPAGPSAPAANVSFAPTVTALPTAVERIERALWGQPKRVQQALIEEGERALRADDERLAETLFARSRDFDGDDARGAYGLARVRLAQGDLEGAEGWVLLAIRQHPRRAEYRALHAEILQRFGRGPEAQLERALARSLPTATPHFPAETRSR
jgi:hypothetical protein